MIINTLNKKSFILDKLLLICYNQYVILLFQVMAIELLIHIKQYEVS